MGRALPRTDAPGSYRNPAAGASGRRARDRTAGLVGQAPSLRRPPRPPPWPGFIGVNISRHPALQRYGISRQATDRKPGSNGQSISKPNFLGPKAELVCFVGGDGFLLLLCSHVICCSILAIVRSEEHTSELQSLRHLVCRLLL